MAFQVTLFQLVIGLECQIPVLRRDCGRQGFCLLLQHQDAELVIVEPVVGEDDADLQDHGEQGEGDDAAGDDADERRVPALHQTVRSR